MLKPLHALSHWLAEHNIDDGRLTVILNFSDREAAVRFEAAVIRELEPLMFIQSKSKPLNIAGGFEVHGIKVKVESPVHEPDFPL